jgi:hypothetical protein
MESLIVGHMSRACARLALFVAVVSFTGCNDKTGTKTMPDLSGASTSDLSVLPDLSTVTAPDMVSLPLLALSTSGVTLTPTTLLGGPPSADLLFVTEVLTSPRLYVAGGSSGALISSQDGDGLSWQAFATVNKPATAILTLAYDGVSTYVLSGPGGVYYQANATTGWIKATIPNNSIFKKVIRTTRFPYPFVGVGPDGILLSSDGVSWTNPTLSTATGLDDVYEAARIPAPPAASNELLVAVGLGGAAWTSDDGNTWVDQTAHTLSSNELTSVTSRLTLNGTRIVAVGNANPPDILYSDDFGASWQKATRPASAGPLWGVTWTGASFYFSRGLPRSSQSARIPCSPRPTASPGRTASVRAVTSGPSTPSARTWSPWATPV